MMYQEEAMKKVLLPVMTCLLLLSNSLFCQDADEIIEEVDGLINANAKSEGILLFQNADGKIIEK